jgi:hypothetical protein
MAFIVETGEGIDYANSYSTVSYADDYHSLRLNTTWSGTTVEKEAALVKATDYIEGKYGPRFRGEQATLSGISFPRVEGSAYYDNGTIIEDLPENVKKATVEYALLSLNGNLYPSSVGGGVTGFNRSVGSISESVTYTSTGASVYKVNPQGDNYIVGLLKTSRSDRA